MELVSISEAARQLAASGDRVDRSTLSRYVQRHADALNPKRKGKSTLVSVDALRRHRAENIHLDVEQAAAGTPPTAAPVSGDEPASWKQRRDRANAMREEIELERMLGTLCPVSEVQRAGQDTAQIMIASEDLIVREMSEKIARALGVEVRVLRPHVKEFGRRLREAMADALVAQLAELGPGDDDGAGRMLPAE